MRPLATVELERMRTTQETAMHDTCIIQTRSAGSQNSLGETAAPTYTDGDPTACGFDPLTARESGDELERADKVVLRTEAKLRLPLGTTVTAQDRVKVTHRNGTAETTPLVWEIVGPVKKGPTAIMLDLRRLTL